MNQTRKMWASAAVVGVIVVGGASVAAAASAGKLDAVARETRAVVDQRADQGADQSAEQTSPTGRPVPSPGDTEGVVVSTEINPDPREVIDYWTDKRMEEAEPMPMPEGTGSFEVAE
ncbi:hypothetical protein ACWEJ6_41810 [Nonomuraea sp. NPDC004702]